MQTKTRIARKLPVTADSAWSVLRRFGELEAWFPAISSCRVEGEGIGAKRFMDLDGGLGSIVDELITLDEEARRLTYRRTEVPIPLSSYIGTVEVFTSYDRLAVVSWTVDFVSAEDVASSINELLVDAIGAGVDGLGAHLAGGSARSGAS
jgi:Polyketide cyclase / dehydrase and lipid transport